MKPIRIAAIDVFRALTMFLMIFVNDIAGLRNIPHWMKHAAATEDMMGLSDIVFPCFLFIMGMAIPFAVQNRISKGDSTFQVFKHILIRSIALLIMGVFTVNSGSVDAGASGYNAQWFTILMVVGFFLVWNIYPKVTTRKKYLFTALKMAGALLLVWLAVTYRTKTGDSIYMQPRWWGILGLLGWSYLICSTAYLFMMNRIGANIVFWCVCTLVTTGVAVGWIGKTGVNSVIAGHATLYALTAGGVITSLLVRKYHGKDRFNRLAKLLISAGIIMLIAGFIAREWWIISKIQETPTWLFLCMGIALISYTFIHYLIQIRGKQHWFNSIKPAGEATLTCYLIPYAVYSIKALAHISYPHWMNAGAGGLMRSLVFTFLIIGIVALLGKFHIKLKI